MDTSIEYGGTTLGILPAEVLSIVGSYCAQADLVNLGIACPKIQEAVLPCLYRCILVDPMPRSLYDSRPLIPISIGGTKVLMPVSTVHTIGGIKQLFATLAARPHLASMVRSFTVKGNIAISDNLLIPSLHRVLRNLDRIEDFVWTACPELHPEDLAELPLDKDGTLGIQTLCVDLATRPYQIYPKIRLPCLRRLQIRPFLNYQVLLWLRSLIMDSERVEEIKLSRFLDSKVEIGSSFAFVGLSDVHSEHDICPAVSIFFDGSTQKHQLKCLELIQIDTSESDVSIFCQAVEISALSELTLVGSGHEDELSHQLLASIVESSPQLRRAELNWHASYLAINTFLQNCCRSVSKLTLTIHEFPRRVLQCLAKTCSNITHLVIKIKCDFTESDLKPILELENVVFLKLPFNYVVKSWEIAKSLPKIKVVELTFVKPFGSSSFFNDNAIRNQGRFMNMGLLTSGILDQWNDSHRSPLQYTTILDAFKTHNSVQYIILDGSVIPMKPNSPPLESYGLPMN